MKIIYYLFIIIISNTSLSFSQETGATKGEEEVKNKGPKYKISLNFQREVYHQYRFTETINVKRIFEGQDTISYEKSYTFWFLLISKNGPTKDRFNTVKITVDSMKYSFKQAEKKVEHFSQDEFNDPPLRNRDFLYLFILNSKEFLFTYSPYGDVAEMESVIIDNFLREIEPIEDEKLKTAYRQKVSKNDLANYFDVAKGVFPPSEVHKEDSWLGELNIIAADRPFQGEVTSKFIESKNRKYYLETICDSMQIKTGEYFYPDIDKWVVLEDGNISGIINSEISSPGVIDYMTGDFKISVNGRLNNLKFEEIIETKLTWDLIKRYSF